MKQQEKGNVDDCGEGGIISINGIAVHKYTWFFPTIQLKITKVDPNEQLTMHACSFEN